jgi:uncharacterized iron-regulated membrane protein
VHGWASLPIWALFCFICLTGTVAVISHELTWLTNPHARAANPDNLPHLPLSDLTQAAQARLPDAEIGHVMVLEPYLVSIVTAQTADMPNALIYINPYTAEIQDISQGLTFPGFMRALHGWLLFPWQDGFSWGYYLVGIMSLVTLTAVITGMVAYKKFWRALAKPTLRFRHGARIFLGDFHRLTGVWSIWFLLIIGLTGFWYLSQAIMWDNDISIAPHGPTLTLEQIPAAGSQPTQIDFADALGRAQRALPEMNPAWISFPEHSRDNFLIAGSGNNMLFDQYSYRVYINPWNGDITSVSTPTDMGVLQSLSHIADPLHYGTLGGIWTKIIWFIFGALLTAMSISGFLIWGKRTLKGVKKRTESIPVESFA